MFKLDLIRLEMSKVQATALVMFTLQVKKSLELKRSKSDDSHEEWSICQSHLRPAASLFRPVGHSLRPAEDSLRPATTSQKFGAEILTNSTPCGPQKIPSGPQANTQRRPKLCPLLAARRRPLTARNQVGPGPDLDRFSWLFRDF